MRVSREQVAENRRRIVAAADRLFRVRGFDAVTVAEVMQAAGLTHGGFYGYFASKDELMAEAFSAALTRTTTRPLKDFAAYTAEYLSPSNRDDATDGCPTAALAAESIRQGGSIRAEMTAGIKQQIERFSRVTPGADAVEKRRAAIGSWAAMVGAMILARASDDPALSDELLAETRAWLEDKNDYPRPGRSRVKPAGKSAVRPRAKSAGKPQAKSVKH